MDRNQYKSKFFSESTPLNIPCAADLLEMFQETRDVTGLKKRERSLRAHFYRKCLRAINECIMISDSDLCEMAKFAHKLENMKEKQEQSMLHLDYLNSPAIYGSHLRYIERNNGK